MLRGKPVKIITIHLNKSKVYSRLHDQKHVLYNYVTHILLDRAFSKRIVPLDVPLQLIASRRETNHFLNLNFSDYLAKQAEGNHKAKLLVSIAPPQEEKCLQIVDCVCWAIFRKIEHQDSSYADIIRDLVVEDNPLFP